MKGDKNKYTCLKCGHHIFTLDLENGVTAFQLVCRSQEKCDGWMVSSFYRIDQSLTPDMSWYEWYDARPDRSMKIRPILTDDGEARAKKGG